MVLSVNGTSVTTITAESDGLQSSMVNVAYLKELISWNYQVMLFRFVISSHAVMLRMIAMPSHWKPSRCSLQEVRKLGRTVHLMLLDIRM